MTNEHIGTCIYEKGRFELRETDNAIIDLKGDFPPIMIASNTVDDGSEPNCADTRSVLHLLNELADNNPNEEMHWYLKKMLDKSWKQYHEQKEENEQLKSENKNLKSNVDDLMNMELEDRDIVCQAGKFRLEEWGKHRLHQFYDGDTPLEDETVVIRLMDLTTENEELKQQLSDINGQLVMLDNCDNWDYDRMKHTVREIAEIIGYNGTINPKR